jgi:DNA polymerase-3 subunit epsilon
MLLSETRLVVFDIESTGVDTASDRVVEFGAAIRDPGVSEYTRRRVRVNPGIPIPKGASDVHGIVDATVADCPQFPELWPRVKAYFEGEGTVVAGYNILAYDQVLVTAECERHGLDAGWPWPTLDAMVFVNWKMRGQPRKLTEVCARFGIHPSRGQAHSAAVDCQMTGELITAMADKGMIPADVDEALDEQARLRPLVEAEYQRYGAFLFRCRETSRLRMGAGKHIGMLLSETPKSYLSFITSRFTDLAPSTMLAMKNAMKGDFSDESQETVPGLKVEVPIKPGKDDGDVRR